MTALTKKTAKEIYLEYGYPAERMADAIRNRSRGQSDKACASSLHVWAKSTYHFCLLRLIHFPFADMLAHGFEWTLLNGLPANQAQHRYKPAPACCHIQFDTIERR